MLVTSLFEKIKITKLWIKFLFGSKNLNLQFGILIIPNKLDTNMTKICVN